MLNFFDILVFLVFIGLAVAGYREGFIRGAIKLAGFIILIIVIAGMSGKIIDWAQKIDFLPSVVAVPIIFITIFVTGTICFHIIAKIIHEIIHMTPVGFIDSGLGCALGVLKSLLVSGLIALALSCAPSDTFFGKQYDSSSTAKPLMHLLSETIPFVKYASTSIYRRFSPLREKPDSEENKENESETII